MDRQKYSWLEYIYQRVHKKNKNFLYIVVGPTGSGKSWAGLSMGEMIDPDFNMDRVIFKSADMLKLVNSGTLKRGSFILWDEAGIDLSNRDWQKKSNKVLNFLLQTWRHKGYILCLTVPFSDFVDLSSRKLLHAEFETTTINKKEKTCRIKPKFLQYNSDRKKWYRPYLKIIRPGHGMIKVKRWKVKKPSDELVELYEKKKLIFTNELNNEIGNTLDVGNKERLGFKSPLTEFQNSILDLWKQGIFHGPEIEERLKCNQPKLSMNLGWMRRKNCLKEDYEEKYEKSTKEKGYTRVYAELTPATT